LGPRLLHQEAEEGREMQMEEEEDEEEEEEEGRRMGKNGGIFIVFSSTLKKIQNKNQNKQNKTKQNKIKQQQ
jgi:hypothetical protein